MQKTKRIPVTIEGYEKLQRDLAQLKAQRPQAVKNLSEARSMGDLSENGLYTAAKARLRGLDSEIFRLEIQIKLADIKEGGLANEVQIGSKVEVLKEDIKTIYQIVGDFEADPLKFKISQHSPLGKALIGKKEGETFEFRAPKGIIKFKITSVK